ncbi:hypothetical protein O181_018032 [Austropuccinia psidii MF-1]|uniref:Uncharacterized protein n=1 Tax=Austropuccinia psidii MF-1 TaxID=1389203 RepID=A0A9Q3GT48_9BASI|nr:hypothetical protein [Austropuccinia psidii MF-1]
MKSRFVKKWNHNSSNDHPREDAVFFVDGMISDVEPESPDHSLTSMYWRSNQIGDLFKHLDEGYKQLSKNPRSKSYLNNSIQQLTPDPHIPKAQGFGNIPNKIPFNWVAPEALASFTEGERRGIKLQEPVDLSLSINKLRSITTLPTDTQSSYMKT